MNEFWETLLQIFTQLGVLLVILLQFLFSWSLVIAWVAWWLWGVNWKKAWPVLAEGAWLPLVLVAVVAALVWSKLASEGNFWLQLCGVAALVGIALFCGWLQGVLGWTPAEIDLEPPETSAPAHAHH